MRVVRSAHARIDPAVLLGIGAVAEDDIDARRSLHDGEDDHDHDDDHHDHEGEDDHDQEEEDGPVQLDPSPFQLDHNPIDMGLVADSLDMLADAFVYALSLAAVGGSLVRKRRLAAWSGYLQGGLALLGLAEVVRRFVAPMGAPDVGSMIVVSLVALAANVATLLILRRTKRGEAHIEASWIFTSNDIKVNALVILAGLLVWWSSSQVPDLIAGGLIFLIVANGTRRILALSKGSSGR